MGLYAHGLTWSLGTWLYSTSNCEILRVKITLTIRCLIKSQETKPFIVDYVPSSYQRRLTTLINWFLLGVSCATCTYEHFASLFLPLASSWEGRGCCEMKRQWTEVLACPQLGLRRGGCKGLGADAAAHMTKMDDLVSWGYCLVYVSVFLSHVRQWHKAKSEVGKLQCWKFKA